MIDETTKRIDGGLYYIVPLTILSKKAAKTLKGTPRHNSFTGKADDIVPQKKERCAHVQS